MAGRKIRLWVTILLVVALLATPGCWSRREMEALSYILLMGLDTTPEGNIRLFAQVGLPTKPGEGGDDPVMVTMRAEGLDISEALNNIYLQSSREPNLSHLRMIVISEELAREGIETILDYLRRDTGIRLSVRVAVTAHDLDEMLEMEDPLKSQPAQAIIRQFDINTNRSSVVPVELMNLISQLLEPDREMVLPIIEVAEERWSLGKTAVFRDDKLVTDLDRHQTFGLLLWRNEVTDGVITVPHRQKDKDVSFTIISSDTNIKTEWEGSRLIVKARVDSTLDINEIRGQRPEDIAAIANTYMVNQMNDVIDLAKENGTDFLGLAVHFRRSDPKIWSSLQEEWQNVLRDAEYDVRGKVNIRGQGQTR